jgi:hypothetical protein
VPDPAMRRAVTFIRVPSQTEARTTAYEEWYDGVHIPFRMTKPGFLGAQRYEMLVGRQRYFVLYELSDPTAVISKEYLDLRAWEAAQPPDSFEAPGTGRPGFERGIYDQLGGTAWPAPELETPFLHIAGYHPAAPTRESFATWLRQHHVPLLGELAGVAAVRWFAITDVQMGEGTGMHTPYPQFFTACYLQSDAIIDRADFIAAQAASRKVEDAPAREPYVVVGKLVHTARGASLTTG